MNWFSPSLISQGGIQPFPAPQNPAQALSLVIENVNCLISILRLPNDSASLRSGTPHPDLPPADHERLSRHAQEALKGLQTLAAEYKVPNVGGLFIPKQESETKILSPQTHNLVSSFEVKPEDESLSFSKYLNTSIDLSPPPEDQETDPKVDSSGIEVGLSFPTLKEAESAFEEYAVQAGFTTCKGNSKKDVYQEFACSSRGKKRDRKVADPAKRRNRKSIKNMCRCHIILRKKEEEWVISTRKLTHTHELMPLEEVKRMAKHRQIPSDIREHAISQYVSGVSPAKIQEQFEKDLGTRCTWSMKDLYNALYRFKLKSANESKGEIKQE